MSSEEEKLIERLRKKFDISNEEDCRILEDCEWNLLDAVVKLEKSGNDSNSTRDTFFRLKYSLNFSDRRNLVFKCRKSFLW